MINKNGSITIGSFIKHIVTSGVIALFITAFFWCVEMLLIPILFLVTTGIYYAVTGIRIEYLFTDGCEPWPYREGNTWIISDRACFLQMLIWFLVTYVVTYLLVFLPAVFNPEETVELKVKDFLVESGDF